MSEIYKNQKKDVLYPNTEANKIDSAKQLVIDSFEKFLNQPFLKKKTQRIINLKKTQTTNQFIKQRTKHTSKHTNIVKTTISNKINKLNTVKDY